MSIDIFSKTSIQHSLLHTKVRDTSSPIITSDTAMAVPSRYSNWRTNLMSGPPIPIEKKNLINLNLFEVFVNLNLCTGRTHASLDPALENLNLLPWYSHPQVFKGGVDSSFGLC